VNAKSLGADFDGFLRFNIMRENRLLYRCQIDWKGQFSDKKIYSLVSKMRKDLSF